MLINVNTFNLLKSNCFANSQEFRDSDNTIDITVMLSSGVDSVAVLHYIAHNKRQLCKLFQCDNINLRAYHFNHKLRIQNDVMEKAARELCTTYNIPLTVKHSAENLKTEEQARKARFAYLKNSKSVVVTGHHLDDCVESYMLNVLRGHEGWMPIPFCTRFKECVLMHLFLLTPKHEFLQYAIKHNLTQYIVNDETNAITKGSRRNIVRNEILPILKREQIGLSTIVKKKILTKLKQHCD